MARQTAFLIFIFVLFPAISLHAAKPSMEVISTDPASPAVLEPRQYLYVKFRYDSGGAEFFQVWARPAGDNPGSIGHACSALKDKVGEYEGHFYFDNYAAEIKGIKLIMMEGKPGKKRETIFQSITPVDFKWKAPKGDGPQGYAAPGASVKIISMKPPLPAVLKLGEKFSVKFQYDPANAKSIKIRTWPSKKGSLNRPAMENFISVDRKGDAGVYEYSFSYDKPISIGEVLFYLADNDINRDLIQYRFPVDVTWAESKPASEKPVKPKVLKKAPLNPSALIDAAIAKKFSKRYEGVWVYKLKNAKGKDGGNVILQSKRNKGGKLKFSFLHQDIYAEPVFVKSSVDQYRANVYFKLKGNRSVMYSLARNKQTLSGTVYSSWKPDSKVTLRKLTTAQAIEAMESNSRKINQLNRTVASAKTKAENEKKEKDKYLERLRKFEPRLAKSMKENSELMHKYEVLRKEHAVLEQKGKRKDKENRDKAALMKNAVKELKEKLAGLEVKNKELQGKCQELRKVEGLLRHKMELRQKHSRDEVKDLENEISELKERSVTLKSQSDCLGRIDKQYQKLLDKETDKTQLLLVYAEIARNYLQLGNDKKVTEMVDKMYADFADNEKLGWSVYKVGEDYFYKVFPKGYRTPNEEQRKALDKCLTIWMRIIDAPCDDTHTMYAYYYSALGHRYIGQYAKAVEYCQYMVKNLPETKYAHLCLYNIADYASMSLKMKGDIPPEEAAQLIEEGFKGFIDQYPDYPMAKNALRKLAEFYSSKSRVEDAINCYEKLIDKDINQLKYVNKTYCLALKMTGRDEKLQKVLKVLAEIQQKDQKPPQGKSGKRDLSQLKDKVKPRDDQAESGNVTIRFRGKITSTKVPGYINIGDVFQVVAVLDNTKRDRSDYYHEKHKYERGIVDDMVSWGLTFLEGSTGSYKGASVTAATGGNCGVTTFDHAPGGKDQFGIGIHGSGVVSEKLGESVFYSCGVRIWDSTGLSLNDTGGGQTLPEITRNYQIIKEWVLENGGDFDFNVKTNGGGGGGANGVVESIVIVSGKTRGENIKTNESSQPVTKTQKDKSKANYYGTVSDSDGNAIEGARLHILRHARMKGFSGKQGEYEIIWDSSGRSRTQNMYIIARHEEKNLASAAKIIPGKREHDITLVPAMTVAGKVTDSDGNALENAKFSVGFMAGAYITYFSEERHFGVDSQGMFKVPFVPPNNRYSLGFRAEGYGSEQIIIESDDAVSGVVKLEPTVLLKADQTVSGVVVDSDGKPVPKVTIYARGDHQPTKSKGTDADGKFSLDVCKGDVLIGANVTIDGKRMYARKTVPSGSKNVKMVLKPR